MATTVAPTLLTTACNREYASGSVVAVGVNTHVRPTNIVALAPSIPSSSEPAIG